MPLDFSLDHEPPLARAALDRAAELRDDEEALLAGWPTALVMRIDRSGRFVTDPGPDGERVQLEPAFDLADQPPHHAVFLGRDPEGRHVWAHCVGDDVLENPTDLRRCGSELAPEDAAMAAEAVALVQWHREAVRGREPRFHPRRTKSGWAGLDPFHGGLEFPRTDPAVICLVHDGGRQVLLGRNPSWPEGRFSVLAGFVEAGESLEGCVHREILEEVGLDVQRPRYLGSQPWPFPRSLMVAFHALGDPDVTLVPEEGEISEARWFDVDEVREALTGSSAGPLVLPPSISIARTMIESWVRAVDAADELGPLGD